MIEGMATQGSINIDGSSAVRRSCSLTMIAKDININDYYWGLKNKFKLEIGLRNTIKDVVYYSTIEKNNIIEKKWGELYPQDIIWFPQGIYTITTFNTTHSANNYTINISGKDKMSLLNGDLGGSLSASIDFGVEEFYDKENNTTIYTKVPIKKIIREMLHNYALEPYHNIIINDLDEAAVELLEYRGDIPLYLLRDNKKDQFVNYTDNKDTKIYFANDAEENNFSIFELESKGGYYDSRIELDSTQNNASEVKFVDGGNTIYTISKIEYGQTVGYRQTELTYAGDLISNIGESITSILDKIKNMLGEYEYFYDLDGRFIFQKKKNYIQTSWNNIVKVGDEEYVENAAHSSSFSYKFDNNTLITSFQNNPNLQNLKNDYSVWGERQSVSGIKIPIHYRCAIDIKPKAYKSINITDKDIENHNKKFPEAQLKTQSSIVYSEEQYDWREIIYQMAKDYYQYNQLDCFIDRVIEANPYNYYTGVTGYEQYYSDIYSYWRELYDINPQPKYKVYVQRDHEDKFISINTKGRNIDLYLKGSYKKININDIDVDKDYKKIFALIDIMEEGRKIRKEMHPWADAIILPEDYNTNYMHYYIPGEQEKDEDGNIISSTYVPIAEANKDNVLKTELFIKIEKDNKEEFISIFNFEKIRTDGYNNKNLYIYDENEEYYNITEINDTDLKELYLIKDNDEEKYFRYLYISELDFNGQIDMSKSALQKKIAYQEQYFDFITEKDVIYYKENDLYWTIKKIEDPSLLNFWFDFLDANSELGQFSIRSIGDRVKTVNDKTITSIYFRKVPKLIFTTFDDYKKYGLQNKTGYTPVFITGNLENMFSISPQGKSAQDGLDELLYKHSYCIENVTIQAVPIYYLSPNTRVFVQDNESGINGEYIISKITLPLAYNGTMSITATKAPERIV